MTFTQWDEISSCASVINQKIELGAVLNYVWDGSIFFRSPNGETVVLSAGTAYWTFPDYHFHYGPVNDSWHQMWIVAVGSRVDTWRATGLWPTSYFHQAPRNRAAFEERLRNLYQLLSSPRQLDKWRCANWLENLLLDLREDREASQPLPHNRKLIEFINTIQQHPEQDYNFRKEAAALYLSYSHFRRLFKEQTGRPPQDFLLHARMQLAAQRLRQDNLPVKQVAGSLGYANLHYFSRIFKTQVGLAPRDYQKQNPF